MTRLSESGEPIEPVYGPKALDDFDPVRDLGEPGEFPYTRGVYPTMYAGRPWTMRQYAGFSSAADSNRRYQQLIAAGTTGLSVAFDLPTQMGYDSDAPQAQGEVGKVGVAIDSIDDMLALFDGIPLGTVSTSMTINAPAAVLLLLYELVAEEQRTEPAKLTGTIQNDILKEYIARGTYIYPPAPSLRLVADTFAYCRDRLPRWNTISISGYHMAEAGATQSRRSRSPWPTPRNMSARPSPPGSRSTTSPRACRSSSWPGPRCSRRSRSSGPPAGCGRTSWRTSSVPGTPGRRCSGSTPRPRASS